MTLAGLREALAYGGLLTDADMLIADAAPGVARSLLPFAATPRPGFMLLRITGRGRHLVAPIHRPRPTHTRCRAGSAGAGD